MKEILADKTLSEINSLVQEMGEPSFRAKQIFTAVASGKSISDMTVIPNLLKDKLKEMFFDKNLEIIKTLVSKDKTEKYLYKLNDGNVIEGVFMRYSYGNTLCVSTQVGCRMGCVFCASTIGGLVRNLTAGEILSQVLQANCIHGGNIKDRAVTNVVLMGSGEPLDNYDNTVKFLRLISDENGLNMSPRNISLSTSGIVPSIYKLADEKLPVNLTISLHSPFDEERREIMPIARKYTIKEILDGCSYYFEKTGRRYIFEYSLIKNKNDDERHAIALCNLLKGRPCHINLIRLNEVKENKLYPPDMKRADAFLNTLIENKMSATLRRLVGADIEGACGQLRRKFISEEKAD